MRSIFPRGIDEALGVDPRPSLAARNHGLTVLKPLRQVDAISPRGRARFPGDSSISPTRSADHDIDRPRSAPAADVAERSNMRQDGLAAQVFVDGSRLRAVGEAKRFLSRFSSTTMLG